MGKSCPADFQCGIMVIDYGNGDDDDDDDDDDDNDDDGEALG